MKYAIAYTLIPRLTAQQRLGLLKLKVNPQALFEHPQEELARAGVDVPPRLLTTLREEGPALLARAEREAAFCTEHDIHVLLYGEPDYPTRLLDCEDAPALLYYRGTANLNARHVISVVGTRNATEYGKRICAMLTEDLARLLPDTLVVSGLAYGIDINAHRGAMDNGLPTVAVVAHGLHMIYPALHRNEAKRILAEGGGILSEYPSQTGPLQPHFLQRNRIVAGMSDAVVVVESADHGGSLATARIATSYNRNVFAVPGRTTDPYSAGCNRLIFDLKASMMLATEDLIREMGWWEETTAYRAEPHQLMLFEEEGSPKGKSRRNAKSFATESQAALAGLSPDEQRVAQALEGSDGMTAEQLATATSLDAFDVVTLLLDLEMSGLVKALPGQRYVRCR